MLDKILACRTTGQMESEIRAITRQGATAQLVIASRAQRNTIDTCDSPGKCVRLRCNTTWSRRFRTSTIYGRAAFHQPFSSTGPIERSNVTDAMSRSAAAVQKPHGGHGSSGIPMSVIAAGPQKARACGPATGGGQDSMVQPCMALRARPAPACSYMLNTAQTPMAASSSTSSGCWAMAAIWHSKPRLRS